MRPLLVAATTVLLALAFVSPAASSGNDDEVTQPAKALAIQALAILEQGGSDAAAIERLDLAVEAKDKEGVRPEILEEAMTAFEAEDPARGEALLKTAFTSENIHVVGVTIRPGSETARVAAGVAGGLVLLLAVFGLAHRARTDRRLGAG